jgi:ferredoxin
VNADLTVDPIACEGHGICAELLPEHVTLDDWGYPIIDPTTVPEARLADARRAVRHCPAVALRLQLTSSQLTSSQPDRSDRR